MANSIDVVIIHHPTENPDRPIPFFAMGILNIAHWLEREGIQTQIIHLGLEKKINGSFDIIDYLRLKKVKVVAFSAHWFFQLPDSLEVAQKIKIEIPETVIVFGGLSSSFFANEIIRKFSFVDAIVRGDGEIPFLQFCKKVITGEVEDYSKIQNLIYKDRENSININDFTYAIREDDLLKSRFANLALIKNHEFLIDYTFPLTRKFANRFNFSKEGLFMLETGRGCSFNCPFCGGNRKAQLLTHNRTKPFFTPIPVVMATIEEAVSFGYTNFYVCFDPDPKRTFYSELFEKIREKKLKIKLIFGAWYLPDEKLIKEIKNSFEEALFEISPETSDEEIRKFHKGAISFSNSDLIQCVNQISEMGLVCQLFFGYFMAGDTIETVLKTLHFAKNFENNFCEAFYLAFSTDPGSGFHLEPEKYKMVNSCHTLEDYLAALKRKRLSSNIITHRPSTMSEEEANKINRVISLNQYIFKIIPKSLKILKFINRVPTEFEKLVDSFCLEFEKTMKGKNSGLKAELVIEAFSKEITDMDFTDNVNLKGLILECIDFESIPYIILEKNFSIGNHYSIFCKEIEFNEAELKTIISQKGYITIFKNFDYDLKLFFNKMEVENFSYPSKKQTRFGISVNKAGNVCYFYESLDSYL